MAIFPGFLGPTYRTRSVNVATERSINWYPQVEDSGVPKLNPAMYPTPGLRPFVQVASAPVRAVFWQDGRGFAVAGPNFYEIFPNKTVINHGSVRQDSKPAQIFSNGQAGFQLFIVSGGNGYVFNLQTDTLTEITDANFPDPCVMGGFVDEYFLALKGNSTEFRISNLLDGLVWNGLDVGQVSQSSDNKIAMAVYHREVWLFGSKRTEVWYNSGNASFPFQPIPGVFIEHGIRAPFSVQALDNSLFWLGSDEQGSSVVWRNQGYTPIRVSTHSIEWFLNQSSSLERAVAYTYQDEGHAFYVLYVPELGHTELGDTTLVYDVATQMWHERAIWSDVYMRFFPHLSWTHAFGWGKHLVGDRQSGTIYEMNLDFYDDSVVIRGGL